MGQAISAILSPALGVLVSPLPVAGLILILFSDKARSNSIFFLLGWMIGNASLFLLGMLFMGLGAQRGDPEPAGRVISLVLGILLILLAVREFLHRPKKGEKPKTPAWFARISHIGVWGAAGFGFSFSALNPVNALLSLSAGAQVGALRLTNAQRGAITVIFVLIASASIIVPTVAFLIAGHKLDKALDALRGWLLRYNAVIMSALLLLIGLHMVGKAF